MPILLLAILCCFLTAPAFAYVGPGPGLTMLGSFFTLVGGIIIALLMVIAYPIRLVIKRVKARKKGE